MNLLSRNRWAALWQAAGASGDPGPWFESLKVAYAEPHRHYHNQRHIAECLVDLEASISTLRRFFP